MGKIELFLHIGIGKTGTSVIQNFLDINRMNLFTRFNCLYPNLDSPMYYEGRYHNHSKWYLDFQTNEEGFSYDIQKLIIFAEKHGINKIVLSFEGWIFQNEFASWIKNATESFNNVEIKTISYIRRADQWFESAWKQWGHKRYESFEEYNHKLTNLYQNILNSYDLWESIHGKENIIVRPYEKQQLPNGLLYDFMACLGIDYDSFSWEKNEETNLALNHGFNQDVLEVMHLARELIPHIHDNHMADLFANLLGDKFQKKPFEGLSILSPSQRLDLINENLPFEEQIARKYMNREDGRIFYDPLPSLEEPWQPYEGITLEKFIPIVVQMVDSLDQKIEKQNLLIERQDQIIKELDERISKVGIFSLIKKMRIFTPLKYLRKRLRNEDSDLIMNSGFFNEQWYLSQYPDVRQDRVNPLRHYLEIGGFEGRDPGPDFSSSQYLDAYDDVKKEKINPLLHYLKYGLAENRTAFPSTNALEHEKGSNTS